MKKVSNNYKRAMQQHLRNRSYMVVTVGIINNEAQASAKVSSQSLYISNNKGLFKNIEVNKTYATFEQNVFKLDGSMIYAPRHTGYEQLADNTAYISSAIKGNLIVTFDKAYDIKGLTINFGEFYPTEFKINGTTYTNNKPIFSCDDSFNDVRTITITPVHFANGDNKRLRVESILMGIGIIFQNEDIESATFSESTSFISQELPQMDFSITCFDKYKRFRVDDNNSFINYLETGQEISARMGIELSDGSVEYVNLPLTYLSSWSSNNDKVAFTSVDRFAFLTKRYIAGNTIHTRTLYDDAVAVLTDAGLEPDEYDIDDFLRTIEVTNPLPEVTHAECLQLIANAGGCILDQDDTGVIKLVPNFENILEPENVTIASDSQAPWSYPEDIMHGAETVYADFSYFPLDTSTLYIPTDMEEARGESGYVSGQIASSDGGFFDNIIAYPYSRGSYSQNGLTFTVDADGTVNVKGTATANTWFAFRNNTKADPNYMLVTDAPWTVGDVLECNYFMSGSCNGWVGITWGYKTGSSSSTQGYIFNKSRNLQFEDSSINFSDVQRQTIDPLSMTDMYVTGYLYIKTGCVIDASVRPTVTKRNHLNNLLVNPPYRLYADFSGARTVQNSKTIYGVTYTVFDDGSILVDGTATQESPFELITPYSANDRLTFVEGHTYTLTEGRSDGVVTTQHSPFLQWVRYKSDTETWDYNLNTDRGDKTYTYTSADSNMSTYGVRIIVRSGQTVNHVLLKPTLIDTADYDANEPSPTHYVLGKKPSLTLNLPAKYTYHSLKIVFDGDPPQQFVVKTYDGDTFLDSTTVDNPTQEYTLEYSFYDFNKMVFEFTRGAPNSRIMINKITFGDLTDYKLLRDDMIYNPVGTVEPKTQSVSMRIFSFTQATGEKPQVVDDNVYYTETVNPTGELVVFENQLISSQSHAEWVAKWIANYFANNVTYEVTYRGEPRIEATDYLFLDSEVINNLQVEVEGCSVTFDGSLKGQLSLRRATKLIDN